MDEKTSHYSCKVQWTRRSVLKRWRPYHHHHWEVYRVMYSILVVFSVTIYMMQTTITATESRRHWQWWDEYNTYMCNANTKSKRGRERKLKEKVKHWNSLFRPNITKTIVYLPSNVQESRPQPLSLIDNTSHLEAKRSMRLMVCILGQKKKAKRERGRESARE